MPNTVKIEVADAPSVIATEPAPLAMRGAAVLSDVRSEFVTWILRRTNPDDIGLEMSYHLSNPLALGLLHE